jgi:hypothetical protein
MKIYCVTTLFVCAFNITYACDIPVFRYALEIWPADNYVVRIVHDGDLSSHQAETVEYLQEQSELSSANFVVEVVDLGDISVQTALLFRSELAETELPAVLVQYPEIKQSGRTALQCPLTMESARELVQSPMRRYVADKILDGASAVWILLECGDAELDDAAAQMLESNLRACAASLTLPELPNEELINALTTDGGPVSPLRIDFPMLRLPADTKEESAFRQMLLHSEDDLENYQAAPMAFPIYGRGRILYALVGAGLNARNIRVANTFITGACSCEIKAENPGLDLLLLTEWDDELENRWGDMASMVGMVEQAGGTTNRGAGSADAAIGETGYPVLYRNLVISGALILIVMMIFGYMIHRRRPV